MFYLYFLQDYRFLHSRVCKEALLDPLEKEVERVPMIEGLSREELLN